jgi:hypothetical protein
MGSPTGVDSSLLSGAPQAAIATGPIPPTALSGGTQLLTPGSSSHNISDPLLVPAESTISMRRLLSAGAAVGLLPFVHRDSSTSSDVLRFGTSPAGATIITPAAASSAAAADAVHHARQLPPNGSGQRTPTAPPRPPGNAGAGGIAGGGTGSAASGVWCALLLCCVLWLAQELRRHRIRLTLSAPSGVVFLLQRPG